MKFPGTYAAYAFVMSIFGQTISGIHLGLLLVNAATVALVFFSVVRLINETAGFVAAASYTLLSVSPTVLGFAAHATHFVMMPVLGGMLPLLLDQHARARGLADCSSAVCFLAWRCHEATRDIFPSSP